MQPPKHSLSYVSPMKRSCNSINKRYTVATTCSLLLLIKWKYYCIPLRQRLLWYKAVQIKLTQRMNEKCNSEATHRGWAVDRLMEGCLGTERGKGLGGLHASVMWLTATETADPGTGTDGQEVRGGLHTPTATAQHTPDWTQQHKQQFRGQFTPHWASHKATQLSWRQ